MFGWEGWFTLAVLTVMFLVLLFNVVPGDFAMLGALATVMAAQIVDSKEGLEGFASSSVLTVAVLYVVAAAINSTGALDYYLGKVLGQPKSLSVAQVRLLFPVSFVSAFLNNTPVVAIMIPIVQRWARKIKQPVSQLFIPLSFASILGGTCTLIGTSTNLVVADRYIQTFPNRTALGLFDLGSVGVPTLFSGFSYIIIFAPFLLPGFAELERRSKKALGLTDSAMDLNQKKNDGLGIGHDFTVGCVVTPYSPDIGKAVDEASLRGVDELYLTSVQRTGRVFNAVGPEFIINEGDILFFTGLVDEFDEFCLRHGFQIITNDNEDRHLSFSVPEKESIAKDAEENGFRFRSALQGNFVDDFDDAASEKGGDTTPRAESGMVELRGAIRLNRKQTFEERILKVVVRSGSSLEGKTAKEARFRKRYGAAILSLSRAGKKAVIHGNLGRIELKVGDVLLIVTGNDFDWSNPDTANDLKPLISDDLIAQVAAEQMSSSTTPIAFNLDIEREFLIPMRVSPSSKLLGVRSLVGLTVEAAGLRGLPGVFLVAIEHEKGRVEHVVGPDAVLAANDILWFVGERESVGTLRRIPGLESPDSQAEKLNVRTVNRRLVECVLSLRSHMVGKTVRECRFRTFYEAAIIAVHRQGHRVLSKIGDIELKAGDVLILDTGPTFVSRYKDDKNFLLVTEIDDSAPPRFDKFYIACAAALAMIISYLFASEYITLFEPAVFASGIMIAAGCITPERARASVSWDVIVTIACAFGLSNAMENSGVAATVGEGLVSLADITNTGFIGVLAAIYLAGFMLSIVIANNATALLLFPIAVTSAQTACPADQDPDLCLVQSMYILMLAASSSFASPYGYQTNTMVLGCGNYVFKDFLRFGFPMQFWQMVFSVTFVYFLEVWYFSWLFSIAIFVSILVLKLLLERRFSKKKGDSKSPAAGNDDQVTPADSKSLFSNQAVPKVPPTISESSATELDDLDAIDVESGETPPKSTPTSNKHEVEMV